jgi:hypothetical protein
MVANTPETKNLLIVSDDTGAYPVVYFYGIEGVSAAEIHFTMNGSFPDWLVIRQEGLADTVAVFSPYDDITESFSIDLGCGPTTERYDNLILNKNVFTAYPEDPDLDDSQNLRVRNIITSLALWTSLAVQTESTDVALERNEAGAYIILTGGAKEVFKTIATVFAIVAVVAVAIAVISCPPAAIAVTSIVGGGVEIAIGITNAVTAVAVGVAVVSGIAAVAFNDAADKIPDTGDTGGGGPKEIPIAEGDPGPAGGNLFSLNGEWFEAAPEDLGPVQMQGGAAAAACAAYSAGGRTDWFLPDFSQLNRIYNLYEAGKISCQLQYWSSTLYQDSIDRYFVLDFMTGSLHYLHENFNCYVRPIRRVSEGELRDLHIQAAVAGG